MPGAEVEKANDKRPELVKREATIMRENHRRKIWARNLREGIVECIHFENRRQEDDVYKLELRHWQLPS